MKPQISSMGRRCRGALLVLAVSLGCCAFQIRSTHAAENVNVPSRLFAAKDPETSKLLANGIEVRRKGMVLQVQALRDDVLRVRLAAAAELPEDASWAVPAEIRQRTVEITPEITSDAVGFQTKALRVRIERGTLRLSIKDLQGNVLQEDEPGWPTEFHGDSFPYSRKCRPTSITLA